MVKKNKSVPGSVLSKRMREQIELEVVSTQARLQLTRLLQKGVRARNSEDAHQIELIRMNRIINKANTVLGRPIYVLEMADWDYQPSEYAWHNGEFELVMRRPDTAQLIEILVDLVEDEALRMRDVNAILESDGAGIRIEGNDGETVAILIALGDLPEEPGDAGEHANVRKLFERMDRAMQDRDWSLVLHTAASIFETVAKQVVSNPSVQNQSLGGWFSQYRKRSQLSAPLLDAMEAIFKRRNIEPLAGHGSVSDASITQEEAIQIRELTTAVVRLERMLTTVSQSAAVQPKGQKP